MTFSEKLDFLMNLTKTRNSALALYVKLDPSHISRLRNGARKPAKNDNYLKAIATYLAGHCNEDYQRMALNSVLNERTTSSTDREIVGELVRQWFLDDEMNGTDSVEHFLDGFSHFSFERSPQCAAVDVVGMAGTAGDMTGVSYGVEGKRQAVIAFLTLVLEQDTPQTLLLFSDEDIGWLSDSREFTARWATLLAQVIMRGNKIRIIHTLSRNLDEMFSAIGEWVPIYMTGTIEPYYYPRTRDGIFRRTLFIAPGTAALISTSIGDKTAKAANLLIKDNEAIEALADEFNGYLSLCRPLMHIFTRDSSAGYLPTLLEFDNEDADFTVRTDALSTMTMPAAVAQKMLRRIEGNGSDELLAYHKTRMQTFEESLLINKCHEIIKIPDLETIRSGGVRVAFSDLFIESELFYSAAEYGLHLENIIRLLQTYDNYNVYLSDDSKDSGYSLYVKEELGVLVTRTSRPSTVFAISESNLTAAFWDFLSNKIGRIGDSNVNNKHAIAKLEAVVKALDQSALIS